MINPQLEMWPEEILKSYRLHQCLLVKGEKPATRPWAGIFDTGEHRRDDRKFRRYLRNASSSSVPQHP